MYIYLQHQPNTVFRNAHPVSDKFREQIYTLGCSQAAVYRVLSSTGIPTVKTMKKYELMYEIGYELV